MKNDGGDLKLVISMIEGGVWHCGLNFGRVDTVVRTIEILLIILKPKSSDLSLWLPGILV